MRIVVGRVLRAHGLRGDVLVDVRTDEPQRRFRRGAVFHATGGAAFHATGGAASSLTVVGASPHGERMRVQFDGVGDRDAAERLRGVTLELDSDQLPPTEDPDDFHDTELIGLSAVTVDGTALGTVADVLHPAQDVLVIDRADGAGEVLVPFVRALVPEVDPAAGRLVVDPPPGLLDQAE